MSPYSWKLVFGTKLLGISIERGFRALKGLTHTVVPGIYYGINEASLLRSDGDPPRASTPATIRL